MYGNASKGIWIFKQSSDMACERTPSVFVGFHDRWKEMMDLHAIIVQENMYGISEDVMHLGDVVYLRRCHVSQHFDRSVSIKYRVRYLNRLPSCTTLSSSAGSFVSFLPAPSPTALPSQPP